MATALLPIDSEFADSRLSRSIWFLGGLMTVHADAKDTNGGFALIETCGYTGNEPPLHVHEREDELFYVLAGRLKVTRGSEELMLEAGESGFLPRGVPHTFRIASGYARWLVYITPAGFEEYFRTLGRPAQKLAPEDHPARPDLERMMKVAQQFGVDFVL
jgi:quercetin dioxygenase-like cupin family protein